MKNKKVVYRDITCSPTEKRLRKIFTLIMVCLLILGLCLMSYNLGKIHAIKSAQPFIVELPEIGDDYFTVFVDYDGDIHEYAGTIC